MAGETINHLCVILLNGSRKHPLQLSAGPDEELTVRHLTEEVERATQVPAAGQKLIFKGRSLTDQTMSLSSLNITEGSKIMLIGRKVDIDDNEHMKSMLSVERNVELSEKKLTDILDQLEGIQKGFLAEDLQQEAMVKLSRRLKGCVEELTSQLEQLDSLQLSDQPQAVKMRRKNIVNRIQGCLDKADRTQESMNADTLD